MFLRNLIIVLALMLAQVPLAGQSPQETAKDVLARFLLIPKEQTQVRSMTMDVDIEAGLPRLKKTGSMHGVRKVDGEGAPSYDQLKFDGDEQIKKDVIVRYLTGEREARSRNLDVGVHEKNYKFNYKARLVLDHRAIYIFKVEPRRKVDGLFKGEVWLDGETGLALREVGRLVRNPSIFFKKTEINRRYEVTENRSRLAEMLMQIETRVVGRVDMQIRYANYAPLTPVEAPEKPAH